MEPFSRGPSTGTFTRIAIKMLFTKIRQFIPKSVKPLIKNRSQNTLTPCFKIPTLLEKIFLQQGRQGVESSA